MGQELCQPQSPGERAHTHLCITLSRGTNVGLCKQSHEGQGRAWGDQLCRDPVAWGVYFSGNPTGAALPQPQGSKLKIWSLGVIESRAEPEEILCSSSRGMLWASLGISWLACGWDQSWLCHPCQDPPALVPIAFHVCLTLLSNSGANPIQQNRIQPLVFLFSPFFL